MASRTQPIRDGEYRLSIGATSTILGRLSEKAAVAALFEAIEDTKEGTPVALHVREDGRWWPVLPPGHEANMRSSHKPNARAEDFRPGDKVFVDSFAGLVPAVVVSVTPSSSAEPWHRPSDSNTVHVRYTGTRGAYKKGQEYVHAASSIVKRDWVHTRGGRTHIVEPQHKPNVGDAIQVGDAVQFRFEPGTGGVVRRLEDNVAWVTTSKGVSRRVPADALRKVRTSHEERVRSSVLLPNPRTMQRNSQLDSRTREIAETAPILNDAEVSWKGDEGLLRIWMGQVGTTFLYYFGSSVEDAFEAAVEWADENAPGLLTTIGLDEYKEAAEDEGIEWNDAWPDFDDPDFQRVVDAAEADMTIIGHTTLDNGNAVPSWEWGVDTIDGEERDIVTARAAPYTYRMSYEIVTPESAEIGDAEERGWEVEEPAGPFTLEDLVREVNDHTWVEWSNSNPTGQRGEWLISEAEQNYSTGEDTSYNLFIERVDGKPLSSEEIKDISKALGVSTFGMMLRNRG